MGAFFYLIDIAFVSNTGKKLKNTYKVAVKFYVKELGAWKVKTLATTLFPKSWTETMINQVILEASGNIYWKSGNKIQGITKEGIKIEMLINESSQEIETAYIIFNNIKVR